MRFLRLSDDTLVHMVDDDSYISLCGLSSTYEDWGFPQTPFGLEYICGTCKTEWVLLQMAGKTIHLWHWVDSLTHKVYLAHEGFDGLLY